MKEKRLKITCGIIALVVLIAIIAIIMILNNKPQYKVAFNSNGGSEVESIIVNENGFIEKPEDPTREGYIFAGWYYNDELFDFSKPITSNIKLEARWTKVDEVIKVSGIKLNKTSATLKVGDELKLNVTIMPENATVKTVTWVSSNPNIVSVDSQGNIKALKKGTATITVTTEDGNFTAKIKITVKEASNKNNSTVDKGNTNTGDNKPEDSTAQETIKVTGVTLNKTKINLYVNETAKLTATIKPNNAQNKNLIWKSSDSSVASVDSQGNIKALKEGTATITVTTEDGNYTASCTVIVTKKPDSYVVTFTAKAMEGTGTVMQYPVSVQKNGSTCEYKFIIYNGTKVVGNLSAEKFNKNITSATIRLTDGTDVTATVNYN